MLIKTYESTRAMEKEASFRVPGNDRTSRVAGVTDGETEDCNL